MDSKSEDYYNIDSLLSEENKLVRDSVRDWVKENVSPCLLYTSPSPRDLH